MTYETIQVDTSGPLMKVTLNRPDRLNALNQQMMLELKALFDELRGRPEVSVVIVGAAGRAFSAGVEFSSREMAGRYAKPELANERLWQLFGHDFLRTLENLEQVTIAAVQGPAVGGGFCLAMGCDFRIAATAATFSLPEVNLGIFLSWGATPRLTALVGPSRAKELIMTAEPVGARQAEVMGLCNRVVAAEELPRACDELAQTLLSKGPLAIRICKKMVNAASVARMGDLYPCEPELVERLMESEDVSEGVRAFLEKRPPEFRRG
ncbi:MAG: enoyl-CoA hydratase/isomerase family protein [Deltaproteobacteria bacterium]|jgi:enoyl-CoA hydratase/carnithine racemase|nr:enoyl-CoA hydratase/isomerase family protein [Deltaproteobacteria bacterium]MBW2534014.1 enoyl-CoA hydratase/isomerase family protein [Deltaproteobacteria bacterium]